MRKKIIIIGSGLGGLAAAIRLASRGHEVEIYEKRDRPGGRACIYEINGYTFDGSPTLITAPFMVDDIWIAAGKNRADDFQMERLDPQFRVFDGAGRSFDLSDNDQSILAQIQQLSPGDTSGYLAFQNLARANFDKGFLELAGRPFLKAADMLRPAVDLFRLRAHRPLFDQVAQHIQDDFLRRVFTFQPLLVGANPLDTPSLYTLIHSLQQKWGIWYPLGGAGALIRALVGLFAELGGKIYLNSQVSEILVQNRLVGGVRLRDGSIQRADIVISNVDLPSTYQDLIAPRHRRIYTPQKIQAMRCGMSLFVLYLGTSRRYLDSGLLHHNFILSPRYQASLEAIFNKKVLPTEFSLSIHIPTLTDPSLAPPGGEIISIVAPVPNLDARIDWTEHARPYRDAILKYLEEAYLPDLRASIVAEHHLDPLHFQNELGCYKGAAFSLLPVLPQLGWFRPHHRSEEFGNLYFTGAGVHPGPGLPAVLTSARMVADRIEATS